MNVDSAAGGEAGRSRRAIVWGVVAGVIALLLVMARRELAGATGTNPITPGPVACALAAVVLAAVGFAALQGIDVRLALFLGALPLFLLEAGLSPMVHKMAAEMANAGTVVPICSAMAFAHVLRLTGCDQELVRLLMAPLRRGRSALVPGGILAGYLINTTIVSQAATAAVLGPILIPLLRAGGLSAASAGAVLLLGSSMGGELYNPGAVEVRKLAELASCSGAEAVARLMPYNLAACSTALLAFWLFEIRRGRRLLNTPGEVADGLVVDHARAHVLKALAPLAPIVLLMVDAVMGPNPWTRGIEGPPKVLTAMLIGVALAAWSCRTAAARGVAEAFWAGAGQGYYHVVSLIVAASTFAEGLRRTGIVGLAAEALAGAPAGALLVAAVMPWILAVVAGTGIAPAIAVMEFFVPSARSMGLDPFTLGAAASLAAHFGRTMSPAAAVVMASARLSGAAPGNLLRLVAPALLCGGCALLAAAMIMGAPPGGR